MQVRKAIEISGIVQGVGFRPFVYRLATERELAGSIANTSSGVAIEVQGPQEKVEEFLARLPIEAPPLARITHLSVRELPLNGDHGFGILSSRPGNDRRALISPDVAVCGDCLHELFDPADRRYLYPFINCTNCGPRFTIVREIPYDRARTSMAAFQMCDRCQTEYEDPANRRFHAQPNACWKCGPRVELWDATGSPLELSDPIAAAADLVRRGKVIAVKGLGGFHLACDAMNGAAVSRLREGKRRVEKPFAIMAPDIDTIHQFCMLGEADHKTLLSAQRPIVLLPKKHHNPIAHEVAPGNRYLGVFLPYTPLHYLLLDSGPFVALVMTSGNLSEEPIAIENREAVERLHELADYFLVHDRQILERCDDSVVRTAGGRVRHLRRSRGFVPVPVFLGKELPEVLAVGGELKNTICLTRGRQAFLSQHIGDLENLEANRFFERTIENLQELLEIKPEIIAYDLHPNYFSTQWALAQHGKRLVGVQHHHAHIAACMAENHLEGRVMGIALDGTGYGTDGTIWGGEILLADYAGFERAAHLACVPMPGGEAAIREPWRMAVSYLVRRFGDRLFTLPIPLIRELPRRKLQTVVRMIERGINSPLTSSCGRLFDAVAALIGLRFTVNYEAQAAIELEMCCACGSDDTAYPFEISTKDNGLLLDPGPAVEAIVEDVTRNVPNSVISRRFHNGLTNGLVEIALLLRQRMGINRVCLSGGTFQNEFLAQRLERRLAAEGFAVFRHSEVPANDGGLSLGQAIVAAHRAANPVKPNDPLRLDAL